MDPKLIVLDVDGVLLDCDAAIRHTLGKKYDRTLHPEDTTHWDISYTYGLPPDVEQAMWEEVWDTPLKPFPGALEFVAKLRETHRVIGLSSRPASWRGLTNSAAARMAAHRDFGQLRLDNYYLVNGGEEKAEFISKMQIDPEFVVEDNPNNATLIHHRNGAMVYLLDRPYNRTRVNLTRSFTRVSDYAAIQREML